MIWGPSISHLVHKTSLHTKGKFECAVATDLSQYTDVLQCFSIYEGLTAEGVLQEFHEKLENDKFTESGATKFITPNGVSSLVKYFLKKSGMYPQPPGALAYSYNILLAFIANNKLFIAYFTGADTKYSAQVTQLQVDNDKWQVTTDTGSSDTFDGVILTIPVPQILQLQGSISNILGNYINNGGVFSVFATYLLWLCQIFR